MSLSSTFLVAASSGSLVDCPRWSAYPTAAPIRERTCLASPTNQTTDWESTRRPASGRAYPQTVSNITTDSGTSAERLASYPISQAVAELAPGFSGCCTISAAE